MSLTIHARGHEPARFRNSTSLDQGHPTKGRPSKGVLPKLVRDNGVVRLAV